MAKIIIEVAEDFKQKFTVECAKKGHTQKSVITYLVEMWLKRKRGKLNVSSSSSRY